VLGTVQQTALRASLVLASGPETLLARAYGLTRYETPAKCPAQTQGLLLAKGTRALLEGAASIVSGPPDRSRRSGRPSDGVDGSLWHMKRWLHDDGADDEGSVMQHVVLTPDLVRQLAGIRGLERASRAYLDMIADCTRAG
jgi:hypothetical protein